MLIKKHLPRAPLVQNDLDICIAGGPGIAQQFSPQAFEIRCSIIPKEIQRRTQRSAPTLIPTCLATGMTATIARPATNSMSAAPGSAFAFRTIIHLNLECRWVMVQILSVVCNPESRFLRFNFQGMRQTEVAKFEMMTVSFAISSDVY